MKIDVPLQKNYFFLILNNFWGIRLSNYIIPSQKRKKKWHSTLCKFGGKLLDLFGGKFRYN